MNKKRFKKYLTKYQQGGCPDGSMWNPSLQKCVPYEDSLTDTPDSPKSIYQTPEQIEQEFAYEQSLESPELLMEADLQLPNNWIEQGNKDLDSWRDEETNNEKNNGITIPDYTYDLPSAATYLGQSIKDKNALGIATGGLKMITGLGRNVMSGMGLANVENQSEEEMRRNQKNSSRGVNDIFYAEKGGQMKLPQELTGEYAGEEQMMPKNSELEGGEYKQDNQGNVQEVIGPKHSEVPGKEGGVPMNLEEGEQILSDSTKIGKDLAKELRDNIDIKVKATSTYSDVMDKINKSIGLEKITKEQEEVIEKLSKVDSEDEDTRKVNETFLKNKINELEQKKQPLLQEKKMAFDMLFQKQEEAKIETEKANFFKEGGTMDTVNQMAKDFNLPLEDAKDVYYQEYKEGGKHLPKYAEGDEIDNKPWPQILAELIKESESIEDFLNNVKEKGNDFLKTIPKASWPEILRAETFNQTIAQETLDKANNEVVKTAKKEGIEIPPQDDTITPYLPNMAPSQRVMLPEVTVNATKNTPEPGILNLDLSGNNEEFIVPNLPTLTPSSEEEYGAYVKDYEKPTEPKTPTDGAVTPPPTTEDETKSRNITFPTQFRLPPTGVQPHWMPNRTFDRVDPQQVSETPYFEQSNKMTDAQIRAIKDLPPAQRAAALMSISASQSDSDAKFAAEVGRTNAGFIQQADQVNTQTQRMEENAGVQDALSFERRQLGALDNTQQSIKNYFDALSMDQLMKAQQSGQIDLLNDLYGDVDYTGSGVEQTTDANKQIALLKQRLDMLEGSKKEDKKKKTAKAKYGGRFKKYKK